jgi:hypothetical protein
LVTGQTFPIGHTAKAKEAVTARTMHGIAMVCAVVAMVATCCQAGGSRSTSSSPYRPDNDCPCMINDDTRLPLYSILPQGIQGFLCPPGSAWITTCDCQTSTASRCKVPSVGVPFAQRGRLINSALYKAYYSCTFGAWWCKCTEDSGGITCNLPRPEAAPANILGGGKYGVDDRLQYLHAQSRIRRQAAVVAHGTHDK